MVPTTSEIIDSKCIYDKEGTVPLVRVGSKARTASASKLCIQRKCVYALFLNTPILKKGLMIYDH